jgi:hypothetical protein
MLRLCFFALLFALPFNAFGQEKAPSVDKLKGMAADAMKKADVKDARIVDTDNLIVATGLPEAKAKALADSLQKTFALVVTTLKFEDTETKTPVIVYTFADLDQFRQFQRSVLKVRPDDDELAVFDVKKDEPFIAVSARRGDRNPNFEVIAGNEICRALLAKKGGNAKLTEWMKDGFARAVQMRATPASAGTDRTAVLRLAPRLGKGSKGPWVVDKAWSGTGKDKDLIAASLMDFLTFGPGAEKLGNIMNGLILTDNGGTPTFADALKGADWMLEALDREWRDWIAKGSPVPMVKK